MELYVREQDWNQSWASAEAEANKLSSTLLQREKRENVLRAAQLDGEMLDNEVHLLLGMQFNKIFSFFPTFSDERKVDLDALLRLLIFMFSIAPHGTTYGLSMQNLTYEPKKMGWLRRIGFGLVLVGLRWSWERGMMWILKERWGEENNWKKRVWESLNTLELMYKCALVINFIVFLWNGRHVDLASRLLRVRLVYARQSMPRNVNFEYLNRQLVWQGLSEFVLFILPLLNLDRMMGYIKRKIPFSSASSDNQDSRNSSLCPICLQAPSSPHLSPCGHGFCYYCVATTLISEGPFPCPRCGEKVTHIRRPAP